MKRCRLETLAKNGVAHIERCADCGSVTIHVGPLSLRLEERALGPFWAVLAEADARLETRRGLDRSDGAGPLPTVPRGWA